MRIICLPAVMLGLVSVATQADDYTIQIGAYRAPDQARLAAASEVGQLHQTTTGSGLNRVQVGTFGSRAEAGEALERLRALGFTDAFVRRTITTEVAASLVDHASGERPHRRSQDDARLSALSDEERRDVVYLDGRLHRKVGDEFIPLDDPVSSERDGEQDAED